MLTEVLEHHSFDYLQDHLFGRQFGFCLGFSCESALLSVTQPWFSSLDTNKSICAVFLDLKRTPCNPFLPSPSLPPSLLASKVIGVFIMTPLPQNRCSIQEERVGSYIILCGHWRGSSISVRWLDVNSYQRSGLQITVAYNQQ